MNKQTNKRKNKTKKPKGITLLTKLFFKKNFSQLIYQFLYQIYV